MKFVIQRKVYEFNNKSEALQSMTDLVNNELKNKDYYFSHFNVDNTSVFDSYEQYFEENFQSVERVEAVFKTASEFVIESLHSMESYLERLLPEIKIFVGELYSSEADIGSNKTLQLLEGIQWIHRVIKNTDQLEVRPKDWNNLLISVTSLEMVVKDMEEVFENQDTIVFADLLQYEIEPLLIDIKKQAATIINEAGARNGTN
ncbi:hypothetical protein ATL39_0741 [Sinobaca qinghaiensis]|uniref:Uncharacterized protein n=1 Tax=Sinobaca qinghaiensis TaxID=342944 RepID=A0A419V8X0_9BACL|nr:hypothetical protein [Sinobaca qinghaiensis]RKD76522.1 hypothetical protein ATL39_0741 [Sinobaca qinghaiensis]